MRDRDRGSALVITMLILVILTAAGLYAVGISTSGVESAIVAEREQAARNAAEAGLFYGIDRIPFFAVERGILLPNGSRYDVTVTHTGTVPVPGYDMGWGQALFRVRAVGAPPDSGGIHRASEADAVFGPVPSGTGPVDRDAAPYRTASFPAGPPSPFYHDARDPSARSAFVLRHLRRKRILLEGTGNGMPRVVEGGPWTPGDPVSVAGSPAESEIRGGAVVADIRIAGGAAAAGGSRDTRWRTIAVVRAGGEEGGYFAFDITDAGPSRYPVPLWEITRRRVPILGRGRSSPAIGKVRAPVGRSDVPGATLDRWVVLVGAENGILVLEAETGDILQLLSSPRMGEVDASPAIALDRDGYVGRVYVGDLSGNLWRAVAREDGRFDLGGGPFFSITRGEIAHAIRGGCAIVPGEGAYPGTWIYFGSGDLGNPSDGRAGGIFAVYDGNPPGGRDGGRDRPLTERDLADAARFFARIRDAAARFPTLEGTASQGWYAILPMRGETVLSAPQVFFSNLFLATYRARRDGPGAEGAGRVYGFGIAPGKNLGNPALSDSTGSGHRVRTIGAGGIPAGPTVSIRNGGDARLSVRAGNGKVSVFRVPSPRRMKSIRSWKSVPPQSISRD